MSAPRRLFSGAYETGTDMGRAFSIAPDGRRFLMLRDSQGVFAWGPNRRSATQLIVVQNWFEELRRGPGEAAQ